MDVAAPEKDTPNRRKSLGPTRAGNKTCELTENVTSGRL